MEKVFPMSTPEHIVPFSGIRKQLVAPPPIFLGPLGHVVGGRSSSVCGGAPPCSGGSGSQPDPVLAADQERASGHPKGRAGMRGHAKRGPVAGHPRGNHQGRCVWILLRFLTLSAP